MNNYEEKLKCPKCQKYINAASKPYKNSLTSDELLSCQMTALFNCVRKYNKNKGDFFTFLTNCVKWECSEHLRFKDRIGYTKNIESKDNKHSIGLFELKEDIKSICEKNSLNSEIFFLKYINGNTIKEISAHCNISVDKIKKNNGEVKKLLKMVYN